MWNEQEENFRVFSTAASLELWLMGWAQHRWESQTEMWMFKPDLTGLALGAQAKSCYKATVLLFCAAHHCSCSQMPGWKWSPECAQVRVTLQWGFTPAAPEMSTAPVPVWSTRYTCMTGIWQVDITQLLELSCCQKEGSTKLNSRKEQTKFIPPSHSWVEKQMNTLGKESKQRWSVQRALDPCLWKKPETAATNWTC